MLFLFRKSNEFFHEKLLFSKKIYGDYWKHVELSVTPDTFEIKCAPEVRHASRGEETLIITVYTI